MFDLFPNEVSVSKRGSWRYKELYEEVPGAIKVTEKISFIGGTENHEFWSDGVAPEGISEAKKILVKASKRFGKNRIDTDLLT